MFWLIKMNKKGDLNKIIVFVVLFLFVLFILMFFYKDVFTSFFYKSTKQQCKQALYIADLTKIKGNDFLNFFGMSDSGKNTGDVPCPMILKEITYKDEEKIKREIARSLYDSWDMMHMGRLELFSDTKGSETHCIITEIITFKKDAKAIGEIDGLLDYLAEKKVNNPNFKDTTYLEYLQSYNTISEFTNEKLDFNNNVELIIDTKIDYAVMFVYSKEGYLHKTWASAKDVVIGSVGSTIGIGVAVITGSVFAPVTAAGLIILGGTAGGTYGYVTGSDISADWSAGILLIPYTDEMLSKLNCTYMPAIQDTR
jgi:hypothetical protein